MNDVLTIQSVTFWIPIIAYVCSLVAVIMTLRADLRHFREKLDHLDSVVTAIAHRMNNIEVLLAGQKERLVSARSDLAELQRAVFKRGDGGRGGGVDSKP